MDNVWSDIGTVWADWDILLQHLLYVEKINQEITTVEDEVITPSRFFGTLKNEI
jgi:hypothetical protein